MCLYPSLVKNPKYTSNKKNGGNIPPVTDNRVLYVPIGCNQCMECRKQKARGWQIRLLEEIKTTQHGKFITLTFSNQWYTQISSNSENLQELKHIPTLKGYARDNAIATTSTRLFLERWRKKYKRSLRHFFVTELGHEGTENIHLHGIVWTKENFDTIAKFWKYGHVWPTDKQQRKNNYVTSRTVNYIIKYITKKDEKHQHYTAIILTSPGIGGSYQRSFSAKSNAYKDQATNQTYRTDTGHKIALPTYYRNKLYTDSQKEKLWLNRLDENVRYVCGEKVDVSKSYNEYFNLQNYHRKRNKQLGYGDGKKDWKKEEYEHQRREMLHGQRTGNFEEPKALKNSFNTKHTIQFTDYELAEIQRIQKDRK